MACPKQAIGFREDGLPEIDHERCSRCGICAGICDAFVGAAGAVSSVSQLLARFQRIALQGEEVVLVCADQQEDVSGLASNVVQLSCLAQIPPELWAAALGQGIEVSIACDLACCETCETTEGLGSTFFSHAIETAQEWTDKRVLMQNDLPREQALFDDEILPDGSRQRKSLSDFVRDLDSVAKGEYRLRKSEAFQQEVERDFHLKMRESLGVSDTPQMNAYAPSLRTKRILLPRRQVLLDLLAKRPDLAKAVPLLLSGTDEERCCGCLRCTRVCPTAARMPDPQDGSLLYDPTYCVACGNCLAACWEEAVSLSETTAEMFLDVLVGDKPDDCEMH